MQEECVEQCQNHPQKPAFNLEWTVKWNPWKDNPKFMWTYQKWKWKHQWSTLNLQRSQWILLSTYTHRIWSRTVLETSKFLNLLWIWLSMSINCSTSESHTYYWTVCTLEHVNCTLFDHCWIENFQTFKKLWGVMFMLNKNTLEIKEISVRRLLSTQTVEEVLGLPIFLAVIRWSTELRDYWLTFSLFATKI